MITALVLGECRAEQENMVDTVLVAAVSSDGKIADVKGEQSRLTNDADRRHLRSYIQSADLLLFGRKTYEEHKTKLGKYRCVVLSNALEEIRELPEGHLLWNPKFQTLQDICERFHAKSVCILGGSNLYTFAKKKGWIDQLVLTYVPGVELKGGTPLFADLPGPEVWSALENGSLGFRADGPHSVLPGCESMQFPFELRKYRRV